MYLHRILAFASIIVLFSVPAFSYAATTGGINGKGNCIGGITGDPTSSRKFSESSGPVVKSYLSSVENCASACFDEKIVITVEVSTRSIIVNTTASNMCKTNPKDLTGKSEKPQRGCGTGQSQPLITVKTPSLPMGLLTETTIGPKSRCFGAITTNLDSMFGKLGNSDFSGAQSVLTQLQSNYQGNAPGIPMTDSGTQALQQALQGYGVSATDAQTVIAKNPDAAQQLVDAMNSGDQTAAQKAATAAGLTLNGDLSNSTATLTPTSPDSTTPGQTTTQQQDPSAPSTGFQNPADQAAQQKTTDVATNLAGMCDQQGMGGCGNVCPNDNIMVCRTNNPGALTWAQWESKYGGYQCGQNNNTTCFPTVEAGVAAQAELLTTRSRYYGDGNNTILGAICGGGYAASNCSEYASFVSRQTGIPINQTIDPNNAQQIGAIMMAQSRFESGRGVVYTPDQLQSGLTMAYGGAIPAGTSGYVPQTIYGTGVGGVQYSSPFNVTTGMGSASLMSNSPFSGVTPVGYTYGTQYTSSGSNQSNVPVSQILQQTTSGNTITTGSIPTNVTVPANAEIIVQPQSVTQGSSFTISWSSVGMVSNPVCSIMFNGNPFAQGNEGSKSYKTSNATPLGTMMFILQCTAQSDGSVVQKVASVVIH